MVNNYHSSIFYKGCFDFLCLVFWTYCFRCEWGRVGGGGRGDGWRERVSCRECRCCRSASNNYLTSITHYWQIILVRCVDKLSYNVLSSMGSCTWLLSSCVPAYTTVNSSLPLILPWAPAEIFVREGGHAPKKGPCPIKQNVSKNGPTRRKSSKKAPQIVKKHFFWGGGGWEVQRLLLPPPPCGRPWILPLYPTPHIHLVTIPTSNKSDTPPPPRPAPSLRQT